MRLAERQASVARVLAGLAVACAVGAAPAGAAEPAAACRGTVYLTLDTGNMRHAEPIAAILERHRVKATFFVANELTPAGDGALDARWGPYWRRLAAAGHAFGSHTLDHVRFRPAVAGADPAVITLARPEFGAEAGRARGWDAAAVCAEIERVDARWRDLVGRPLDRWWRAPSGRAPDAVFDAARRCGWRHAGWTEAGFLGDELPSDRFPNATLLSQAVRRIEDGDVLMAHLGIRSRAEPYAPMLDRLIPALAERGLCFATLPEHPAVREAGLMPVPRPGDRPPAAPGIGPQRGAAR